MPGRSCRKEIADRSDGVAVFANDLADIALAQAKLKDGFLVALEPGQNHFIRELNEPPDHKFEELFHRMEWLEPWKTAVPGWGRRAGL